MTQNTCPDCGAALLAAQRFCGSCGRKIEPESVLPNPTPSFLSGGLGGRSTALDGIASEMQNRFAQTLSRVNSRASLFQGEGLAGGASASPGLFTTPEGPLVHEVEWRDLLVVTESELKSAWQEVRNSPHIQENKHHQPLAEVTKMVYAAHDLDFNAGASGAKKEGPFTIRILGGLANAFALISAAFGAHLTLRNARMLGVHVSPLIPAFKDMSNTLCAGRGYDFDSLKRSYERTVLPAMLQQSGPNVADFVARARTFRSSMFMAVIGHELGHIVYGHTQGETKNLEISRDMEYDVDSFSRQILSTCKAPEYTFVAQTLVALSFSWGEYIGGADTATTHPMGRQRFHEMFKDRDRRGARIAESDFGLTYEDLAGLLPPE